MIFSARTAYLVIACTIAFLFAGTGAYYLLNLNQSNNKPASTNQASTEAVQATPIPTPAPTSSPETVKKSQTTDSTSKCNSTCEYSYQCPDDLECLDTGKGKFCLNANCKNDNTCACSSDSKTTAIGEVFINEPDTPANPTPTPRPTPTKTPTPKPKVVGGKTVPTPKPETDSLSLPKAGASAITYAVLIIGLSTAGIGILWPKFK